jgi:hypothetical protein
MRYGAFAAALLFAVAGCGGNGTPGGPAHPDGWTKTTQTGVETWTKPNAANQTFVYSSKPFDGTTKDLASQITLDIVLKRHGKLLRTVAFAPCPGEAGLQTYRIPPATLLLIAYAAYGDKALTATYTRPASAPEDPAALAAMQKSVCTAIG